MAEPNWNNRTLFVADNIRVLRGMNSESVDCIATDPPFNKKRIFNAPLGSKQAKQRFDDRWRWDEVTDEWQDQSLTAPPPDRSYKPQSRPHAGARSRPLYLQ